MYCGNNKTACTSQAQIAHAMMSLISTKSYASITVSEICKEASVSRQTFYTLFESKDNVVSFLIQKRCSYEPSVAAEGSSSCLEQFCLGFCRFLIRQEDMIRFLAENGLLHLLYDTLVDSLVSCPVMTSHLEPDRRVIAMHFMAGAFTGVAKYYVLAGCQVNESDLADLCLQFLEGHLAGSSENGKL